MDGIIIMSCLNLHLHRIAPSYFGALALGRPGNNAGLIIWDLCDSNLLSVCSCGTCLKRVPSHCGPNNSYISLSHSLQET